VLIALSQKLDVVGEDSDKQARQTETQDLTRKVRVGGAIRIILVFGSLSMMTGLSIPISPDWLHNPWLQIVLALPV